MRVDQRRWAEAQHYERNTWLEKGLSLISDRNEHHGEFFVSYAPLRGRVFERSIELGCGPFTNMRLILEYCHVGEIYLLDPLLSDYMAHPFCRYRGGRLGGVFKDFPSWRGLYHPWQFARGLANAYRIGKWHGRPVRLVTSPIETFHSNERFDLVVMVNVLEHCQDAEVVLNKILALLKPNGVFVYADKQYTADEIQRLSTLIYDVGHPLHVDQKVIEQFLGEYFEPLLRVEYGADRDFRGVKMHNTELYFIGMRK